MIQHTPSMKTANKIVTLQTTIIIRWFGDTTKLTTPFAYQGEWLGNQEGDIYQLLVSSVVTRSLTAAVIKSEEIDGALHSRSWASFSSPNSLI